MATTFLKEKRIARGDRGRHTHQHQSRGPRTRSSRARIWFARFRVPEFGLIERSPPLHWKAVPEIHRRM